MVRVTNWIQRHKRHKKLKSLTKWFRLWRNNLHKEVTRAIKKQWVNAYVWRKLKKRNFRRLWIERLSSVLRDKWTKYSLFINLLTKKNIIIDRKVLSNIAIVFPKIFDQFFDTLKT